MRLQTGKNRHKVRATPILDIKMKSLSLIAFLILALQGCTTTPASMSMKGLASVESGGCSPSNVKAGDTAALADGSMGVVVKLNGPSAGCPKEFPISVVLANQQ
jgi:hypothetical protein